MHDRPSSVSGPPLVSPAGRFYLARLEYLLTLDPGSLLACDLRRRAIFSTYCMLRSLGHEEQALVLMRA